MSGFPVTHLTLEHVHVLSRHSLDAGDTSNSLSLSLPFFFPSRLRGEKSLMI